MPQWVGDTRQLATTGDGTSTCFGFGKLLSRGSDLLQALYLDQHTSDSQRLDSKILDQAASVLLEGLPQPTTGRFTGGSSLGESRIGGQHDTIAAAFVQ